MNKIGYCRVSTKDQNLDRQLEALKKEGIDNKDIYADRISGKNFARPQYKKMIKNIKEGDLVVIKSIDRLGRNYTEILEQWKVITKNKMANIKVIDMPLLNTTTVPGDLTGMFVADLVLQILAYVAETERTFIKQRQAEGIAMARMRGVKFGRNRIEPPRGFVKYYKLWKEGKVTIRCAAEELGMSNTTFSRRCHERDNLCGNEQDK